MANEMIESEAMVEGCLLQARCFGLLPTWIDVQATAKNLARSVASWTASERAEALTWRERSPKPGSPREAAPAHVRTLIDCARARDIHHAA